MTKEVLKQALEALETNNKAWKHLADSGDAGFWEAEEQPFYEMSVKAITAIKSALANEALERKAENARELGLDYEPLEAKDEAVAHFGSAYVNENGVHITTVLGPVAIPQDAKLYTTPPQRKPLTDEEIVLIVAECAASHQHTDIHFARAIEAKLKEKNT